MAQEANDKALEELLFGPSDGEDELDALLASDQGAAADQDDSLQLSPSEEDDEDMGDGGRSSPRMKVDEDDDEDGGAEEQEESAKPGPAKDAAATLKDLFGSDAEEEEEEGEEREEEEERRRRRRKKKRDRSQEGQPPRTEERDPEEAEAEQEPLGSATRSDDGGEVRIADQRIENLLLPRPPPDAKLFYVKLPNILGVEHEAFDRYTFEADDEDRVIEGPEGQKMKPLPPETIMRWRVVTDEHGHERHESNARFVRWSNGTVQLFLGGDEEVLDVDIQDIKKENYQIFASQPGSIQAHGTLDCKLFFTPSTIHSKSHQKLTMHLVKQSQQKARKVKLVSISKTDPEVEKRNKEEAEQDRIRQNQRKKEKGKAYGLTPDMLEEAELYDDDSDVDEKRILDAKHSSSPVRKRSRDSTPAKKRNRKTKDHLEDFINDEDEDGDSDDIDDWELNDAKRKRSSSSHRSNSDSDA